MMEERVEEIEKTIDNHFELIKETIYNFKKDQIDKQNKKYKEEAAENNKKGSTKIATQRGGNSHSTNRSKVKGSSRKDDEVNSELEK